MGEATRLPAAAVANVCLRFLPPIHARPTYKPSVDLNCFRFITSFEMFHPALFIGMAQPSPHAMVLESSGLALMGIYAQVLVA